MARWRYLFHDLLTNQYLGELPLVDVDFEAKMPTAGPGSFAALLRLGDERVRRTNWRAILGEDREGVSCVYTERDGTLLDCCHVLYDPVYHLTNQTLELSGIEVWACLHRRYISHDRTYSQVDQFDIARDLLLQEFTEPNGDIKIAVDPVGTTPLTGRLRDRSYKAGDGKDLAEAIEQLSQVIDGFDFRIQVYRDITGRPAKRFVLGYPRLGSDDSGLYFRLPGDIESDFDWPRQGSRRAVRAIALGDSGLRQDAIDWGQVGAGVPLMEVATTHTGVTDTATLLGHAQADLSSRKAPLTVPTFYVRADRSPQLGNYSLGDDVHVTVEEEGYFTPPWLSPDGADHRMNMQFRLIGLHVRPDAEHVGLILNTTAAADARQAATA